MTAALRGEWRVLGRSPTGVELLLRPLGDTEVPDAELPGTLRVGTDGYDDAVQTVVDDLRPGNRIEAALYPGREGNAGRLVEVRLLADQRLSGGRTRRVPSVAAALWEEVADASEPTTATQALDTPQGHAEVLVGPRGEHGAGWASFRFGEGLEDVFASFEHAPGHPAEVIALDVADRPFYAAFAFEVADGEVARELRSQASGTTAQALIEFDERLQSP